MAEIAPSALRHVAGAVQHRGRGMSVAGGVVQTPRPRGSTHARSATMSERTTTAPATSTPSATAGNDEAARQLLAGVALYKAATPEQRSAVEGDMARMLAGGMAPEDYLAALAEWPGDAAHYLASRPDAEQEEQHNPASDTAAK